MSDTKTPRTSARMAELMVEPIEHRAMAMAAWAMQLESDLSAAIARAEAAEADARRWQYWKPWLERRLGDLSKYDAAIEQEKKDE